jgi:hypothetical protein
VQVEWKKMTSSETIPQHAHVAGRTAEGEQLYIGRVVEKASVGKVIKLM